MEFKITLVYCICADLLTDMRHQENEQCQLNDAEIMTIAMTAALYFGGNYVKAKWMGYQHKAGQRGRLLKKGERVRIVG